MNRPAATLLVALIALALSACGTSNHKGRIEGRWKLVAITKPGQEREPAGTSGFVTIFEFGTDGNVSAWLEFARPETEREAEKDRQKDGLTRHPEVFAKYRLLSGDDIEMSAPDKPPPTAELAVVGKDRGVVKIDGDVMTIAFQNGTMEFLRHNRD